MSASEARALTRASIQWPTLMSVMIAALVMILASPFQTIPARADW